MGGGEKVSNVGGLKWGLHYAHHGENFQQVRKWKVRERGWNGVG